MSGWYMLRIAARNIEIECVTFLSSTEYIALNDHLYREVACTSINPECSCCICAIGGIASVEEINAIDWKLDTSLNAQYVMRILQKIYDAMSCAHDEAMLVQ